MRPLFVFVIPQVVKDRRIRSNETIIIRPSLEINRNLKKLSVKKIVS